MISTGVIPMMAINNVGMISLLRKETMQRDFPLGVLG